MVSAPARHRRPCLKYPSPDRCLSPQLASAFVLQARDQMSAGCDLPRAGWAGWQDAPFGPARTRLVRKQMDTMAPTRPTTLHAPTGPAKARGQVRATIQAWEAPVDASVAMLLTSELVTNAIRHETGDTIALVITCAYGQLHVDVHDTSGDLPVPVDGPPDAETGRGLLLVAGLSSSWGYYRTPMGKAVYFTLALVGGSGEEDTHEQ